MNHSRNKTLYRAGRIGGSLLTGLSASWWNYKHNMHHIFTNSKRYDEDIDHNTNPLLYPFLFVKWRFDSVVALATDFNWCDLMCMGVHYYLISRQKTLYYLVGLLLSGRYLSYIFVGNHER
jgi:fatty acid desaturase